LNPTESSGGLSFAWDLHYACNYRCPYCWWHGRWEDLARGNVYPRSDKLVDIWRNIYYSCGGGHISIVGGEPLIYPEFGKVVREISQMFSIGIVTNLAGDIADLLRETSPSRVAITPTFHPGFADFDEFLVRAVQLKENGRGSAVLYVAYPEQINCIPEYGERFKKHGLELQVFSFWGEFQGKTYPASYTQEEKTIIGPYLGERAGKKFQLVPSKVKGKLCRAGQRYAVVKANGDVAACGGDWPRMLGNIFAGTFKLQDQPLPCQSGFCPCNEWAYLLLPDDATN